MADAPSPPWKLRCPWCEYALWVNARGGRGDDPGSGVQAASYMKAHANNVHGKTWRDFLALTTTPEASPDVRV